MAAQPPPAGAPPHGEATKHTQQTAPVVAGHPGGAMPASGPLAVFKYALEAYLLRPAVLAVTVQFASPQT